MTTEFGGDETAKRPAVPRTRPATRQLLSGDERDGGDRWDNVYGRREVII